MKNSDYVLRFEASNGVSQANYTNSHSSFFILHSSFKNCVSAIFHSSLFTLHFSLFTFHFSLKEEKVTPILHSSFFILHFKRGRLSNCQHHIAIIKRKKTKNRTLWFFLLKQCHNNNLFTNFAQKYHYRPKILS